MGILSGKGSLQLAGDRECAASWFGSGGEFSDFFSSPGYQESFMNKYLNYNGRAYADLAASGQRLSLQYRTVASLPSLACPYLLPFSAAL